MAATRATKPTTIPSARAWNPLGFKQYVDEGDQGHIIVTCMQPADPAFDFEKFYTYLSEKNCVIYLGVDRGAMLSH